MASSTSIGPLAQTCHELQRFLQSGTFTFLIGPEKQEFQIHSQLVSQTSEVLDRMMNGNMKESVERRAELPSVEPMVFTNFASLCYYGGYNLGESCALGGNNNSEKTFNSSLALHNNSLSNLGIQLLRMRRDNDFYCAYCATEVEFFNVVASFPYCSLAHAGMRRIEQFYCNMCGEVNCCGVGTICHDCVEATLNIDNYQTIEDEVFWTNFGVVSKLTALWDVIREDATLNAMLTIPSNYSEILVSIDLLSHVKMYVFADTYNVLKLKAISIERLWFGMSQYEVTAARIPKVIELIEYTYQNTYVGSESTKGDVLRRLVAKFVAVNAEACMASEEARALFSKGGDIAVDLLQAMTSRT